MALVLSLVRAGAVAPPDPMFLVVLLLSHSTPTAINMQTVATLHQNGEAEMSCLLCAPSSPLSLPTQHMRGLGYMPSIRVWAVPGTFRSCCHPAGRAVSMLRRAEEPRVNMLRPVVHAF